MWYIPDNAVDDEIDVTAVVIIDVVVVGIIDVSVLRITDVVTVIGIFDFTVVVDVA